MCGLSAGCVPVAVVALVPLAVVALAATGVALVAAGVTAEADVAAGAVLPVDRAAGGLVAAAAVTAPCALPRFDVVSAPAGIETSEATRNGIPQPPSHDEPLMT